MDTTIYYGGCWATNIGNAFIDYGALYLCQKYNPYIYSEMDYIYFKNRRQNYFNNFVDFKPKCIFFSGMVTCEQFGIDQREIFELADRYKIPIVLNGVGGDKYNKREISSFREFIKSHNFLGFISRDDDSYEAYHDLFPKAYKGLDCGFFISEIDRFKHLVSCDKKYTVLNSDDEGFNRSLDIYPEYKQAEADGSIVHSHHQTVKIEDKHINLQKTFLSEMPDQYLYLYGRAKNVFSTRVHACVATLSFGGKCVLLYNTPRSIIFKTVGCSDINNSICSVDPVLFEQRKTIHKKGLEEIMKGVME